MIRELVENIDRCLTGFFNAHGATLESIIKREHYFLACGSTGTGVETALSEARSPGQKIPLVMDHHNAALNGRLFIGFTYSGNSTEVTGFIPSVTHRDSVIITGSDKLRGKHVLRIDTGEIPLRCFPLLTHTLVQSVYGREKAATDHAGDTASLFESAFGLLQWSYLHDRIPVFTADNDSWLARLFAEQYMECLKRPAFYMNYPHFTHNILWTLSGKNIDKFCFIHEHSPRNYSDNRREKTLRHIESLGGVQLVLPPGTRHCNVFTIWCSCIGIYERIARENHLNINLEYSFKPVI